MTDSYIFDGVRSPFGRYGGSLSSVRPDDLLAAVLEAVVMRNHFERLAYEDVLIGTTNQAGEDSRNIARFASLLSGMPVSTGGQTVNRLCGSSLAAVLDASRAVRCNEGDLFVAGGVESMSRAPLVLSSSTTAFDRNQTIADSTMGARFSNPRFIEKFGRDSMPETADNIARDLGIDRIQSDRFAVSSQQKYEKARRAGFFDSEIVSVELPARHRQPLVSVSEDEHPRPNTTEERLANLAPLFPGGVVTAGNASGINDGAAALIVGSAEIGRQFGVIPRAQIIAGAIAGVEPRIMGLGPVPATKKALQRAGISLDELDVIELNEAFAAQALGCLMQLEIDFDDDRVNPNGGAIAIGHPLGASGARILLTALRSLESRKGRYALATMCIGLGQGIAIVIERVPSAKGEQ